MSEGRHCTAMLWHRRGRIADGDRKCSAAHVACDLQLGRSLDDVWHEFSLFHRHLLDMVLPQLDNLQRVESL